MISKTYAFVRYELIMVLSLSLLAGGMETLVVLVTKLQLEFSTFLPELILLM